MTTLMPVTHSYARHTGDGMRAVAGRWRATKTHNLQNTVTGHKKTKEYYTHLEKTNVSGCYRRPKTHIAEGESVKTEIRCQVRVEATNDTQKKVRRQGVEAPVKDTKNSTTAVTQNTHMVLQKIRCKREVIRAYISYLHREIRVQKPKQLFPPDLHSL